MQTYISLKFVIDVFFCVNRRAIFAESYYWNLELLGDIVEHQTSIKISLVFLADSLF